MRVCVEYDFLKQWVSLCWQDIWYGLQHEFITLEVAMRFCAEKIEVERHPSDDLMALYLSTDDDEIISTVKILAESESPIPICSLQRKWIYVILSWLYDHRQGYLDPLGMVESVYAAFNYPKVMASFVRYMPMQGPDLGSKEKNEMRMMARWSAYILSERQIFTELKRQA